MKSNFGFPCPPRPTPSFPIRDDSFPHIVLTGSSGPQPWGAGGLLASRVCARFVRISPRGVVFSAAPAARRAFGVGWHSVACSPAHGALCREDASGAPWFPTGEVDVADAWGTIERSSFVEMANLSTVCKSTETGRVVNPRDVLYDVSLCDLVDLNLDVVFEAQSRLLHWRTETSSLFELIALAIVVIYLVSCVSQNVVNMFLHGEEKEEEGDPPRDIAAVLSLENACIVASWVYALVNILGDRRVLFITDADRIVNLHLVLYVAVGLIEQTWWVRTSTQGRHISLLTASVLLLAIRTHYSFDNVYFPILLFLLAWRMFQKAIAPDGFSRRARVMAVVDALLVFSLTGNGFASLTTDHVERVVSVLTLLGLALCGALLGSAYIH